MRIKPINKHTVMKQVRVNGEWKGYIAPNKVNSGHVAEGWHIGCSVEVVMKQDVPTVVNYVGDDSTLDDFLFRFQSGVCCSELGKRVRFWEVLAK